MLLDANDLLVVGHESMTPVAIQQGDECLYTDKYEKMYHESSALLTKNTQNLHSEQRWLRNIRMYVRVD